MSNRYGMMTETKVFPEYQAKSSELSFFREEIMNAKNMKNK
jgi:hypothetical protein